MKAEATEKKPCDLSLRNDRRKPEAEMLEPPLSNSGATVMQCPDVSARQVVTITREASASTFQLSIVIPTYREAENLPVLVPRLAGVLAQAGLNSEILVIDDDSQDGTEMLCKELATTYPVRLIVRTAERGLASAVLRGFHEAHCEILIVMDADLSHPPEKVPELFHALLGGDADFVIGSRYVAGGQTAEKWGFFRWLNSKVATALARPLTSVRNPMAGFFGLHRSTFAPAADRLDPVGYKIALELIVKCGCRRIKELPIQFCDRTRGQSKLNLKEQWNYLRHLTRLYAYRWLGWRGGRTSRREPL